MIAEKRLISSSTHRNTLRSWNVYADKGKLVKAISEFKRCISINPNLAKAHLQLGIVYLTKGHNLEAADHFCKTGLLFLKEGDQGSALKAYENLKQTESKELEQHLWEKLNSKTS